MTQATGTTPSAAAAQEEQDGDGPYRTGTVIAGRYALRRMLGRGGAAVVFAAEHLLVKRPAAVKLPHVDPELREILFARLRRETEALSRVRHPCIVDVVDAGESDGVPFLAMELLDGRTLTGLIAARGKLDPDEVVKVGVELAAGLAAVHAAGIVHRDVKPENVLVTAESNSRIHLFDFGVAKLGRGPEASQSKLTVSGAILGTPEYMPMEALMSAPEADHRVDVYALGVTLFECLTGGVPFDGPLGQILLKVATTEAPALTDVRKDVPKALADVVARALRKEPSDRFQSMEELGRALRACTPRPIASIDLLRRTPRAGMPPLPTSAAPRPPPRAGAAPVPAASPPSPAAPGPQPQGGYEARRGHARAPYVALASIERERGGVSDAKVEDISEGGVLVVAHDVYAAGEAVKLRFGLPLSGRVLKVATTVRWVRTTRGTRATGLEFVELPEAARAEIGQYVGLMGNAPPA